MKNTETELTFLSLLLYKEPEEKQRGRVTYNICVINLSEDLQMSSDGENHGKPNRSL